MKGISLLSVSSSYCESPTRTRSPGRDHAEGSRQVIANYGRYGQSYGHFVDR